MLRKWKWENRAVMRNWENRGIGERAVAWRREKLGLWLPVGHRPWVEVEPREEDRVKRLTREELEVKVLGMREEYSDLENRLRQEMDGKQEEIEDLKMMLADFMQREG